MGRFFNVGKTSGPVLGVSTFKDYQDHKWPYVRKQYGAFDPRSGQVFHLTGDRDDALAAIKACPEYALMSRHVSDWLPDE